MSNVVPGQNPTLGEAVVGFLASLKSEEQEKVQIEVYKFVRWFGVNRKTSELNPVDIASYAERLTPSVAKPVKSLLGYIYAEGFTGVSLVGHFRPKKSSAKTVSLSGNYQGQTVLTAQGYTELKTELAKLKEQRPTAIEEIRKAAADKDFRENAPLDAAREHKARLEGRIQELEARLRSAEVADAPQDIPRIKIGHIVTLLDPSSGQELCYTLVNPWEAKPGKARVSTASPMGKALLGKEKGQTIEVIAPAGVLCYCIKDVQQASSSSSPDKGD